jgi:hypothetical protein
MDPGLRRDDGFEVGEFNGSGVDSNFGVDLRHINNAVVYSAGSGAAASSGRPADHH